MHKEVWDPRGCTATSCPPHSRPLHAQAQQDIDALIASVSNNFKDLMHFDILSPQDMA